MEPLKNGLDRATLRGIGRNIARVYPEFDTKGFVRKAARGLDALELKARVKHVAAVLRGFLPEPDADALDVLVQAGLRWETPKRDDTYSGFGAWPVIELAGEVGRYDHDAGLEALRQLTSMFSAEFAVRWYIESNPKCAMRTFARWTKDDDEHVRRLASEGTRPRLPWGTRLPGFIADPEPVLKILERLKDDPAEYVRRSVANNLNDIAKDHPDRVVEVCTKWSEGASDERRWIVRHATRSLVKQGHPGALKLLGFDPDAPVDVRKLRVSPKRIAVGDDLEIAFELRSTGQADARLVIDYVVHHVKADGRLTPKVFKLKTMTLKPKAREGITKVHKIRKISTRRYYSGKHEVEILVNGRGAAKTSFTLHAD